MKKSILRERRERYYEELRKIGLMDEPKEEINKNETIQEEKPLKSSKKVAKTGKKRDC